MSPVPLAGIMTGQCHDSGTVRQASDQNPDASRVRGPEGFVPAADAVTQWVSAATAQTRTQPCFPAGPPRHKVRTNECLDAQGKHGRGERADPARSAQPPPAGGAANRIARLQGKRSLRGKRPDPSTGPTTGQHRCRPRGQGADTTPAFAGVSAPRPARPFRQEATEPGAEASLKKSAPATAPTVPP